jgi:protein-S-isoprenylcysteine O-methyltransferase Ste14
MFRWFALATLVGCLGISTYYRRLARKEGETIRRGREKPFPVAVRLVLALPLYGAIFSYLINPRWMEWASFALPEWARWVGVALGLLMVPMAYWVFSSIGRNVSETVLTKEHHELVTHGPYRWIRHPLYTMGIALIIAIGLMAANWFILLFALIGIIAIRLVVVPIEEQALLAKFGDEYRDFMGSTGCLLPRVSGRREPRRHSA